MPTEKSFAAMTVCPGANDLIFHFFQYFLAPLFRVAHLSHSIENQAPILAGRRFKQAHNPPRGALSGFAIARDLLSPSLSTQLILFGRLIVPFSVT